MTNPGFSELSHHSGKEDLASPDRLRNKRLLLTVLGHLYLGCILTLALGFLTLAAIRLWDGDLLAALEHTLPGLIAGSLYFAVARLHPAQPEGRRLFRHDAPQLFAMIDKIRLKLDAPAIHRVAIGEAFNATILQESRLGVFGWSRNTLIVGLPLMQALSRKEFAAILAQEYAHLSRRHGRLEAWMRCTHRLWMHAGNALQAQAGLAGRLLTAFPRCYIPLLDACNALQAHHDTLEADRMAASVVGQQTMADALIARTLRGRFLEERFWQGLWSRATHQPEPPFLPHAAMRTALTHGLSAEESMVWLMETMQPSSAPSDPYPGLRERLMALGKKSELPPNALHSSAQSLLGELLPGLQKDFDQDWQARNAQTWRLHFHAASSARETVLRMEARPVEQLRPEELAHLGLALETLGRHDEALRLLRLAAEHPNGPAEAGLAATRLLQARNGGSATHYMDTALRRNPGLVGSSGTHQHRMVPARHRVA